MGREKLCGPVIHAAWGRASNRKISAKVEKRALAILSQPLYTGFGPTLAAEYLQQRHGIQVGRETLRDWMAAAGLWKPRRRNSARPHLWRPRRSCRGELVQWDTSEHDWLQGRGEKLYLIAMIGDASSELLACFVGHDSSADNRRLLKTYLERNSRPVAFYKASAPRLHQSNPLHKHTTCCGLAEWESSTHAERDAQAACASHNGGGGRQATPSPAGRDRRVDQHKTL